MYPGLAATADEKIDIELVYNMTDYCRDVVRHYGRITKQDKIKGQSTPYCAEGSLVAADDDVKGQLCGDACSVLMKALWLTRLGRPEPQKAVRDLASHVQTWSVNDDKKLARLIGYLWTTRDYKLTGVIRDRIEDLYIILYVDANFCGGTDNTRSTSGVWLTLAGPNGTGVPLCHITKRQTATSRSTTESEVVSLAFALYGEAIPALDL